ncbi:hypothetical protein [Armatimonas sp.]|uniref:hypothetical protein n=1 Tax=Armatimonas sp. TaxID=1872638 RepID=UPI00286A12AA|nr:hypothetical protein [Armatimonas sp.]
MTIYKDIKSRVSQSRVIMGGIVLALIMTGIPSRAQTIINGVGLYNAPSTTVVSKQYSIRIKASNSTTWRPASVLWSKLNNTYMDGPHEVNEKYYGNLWGCSHSYVNFEMSQSVDIEVTRIGGTILPSTKIYPENKVTNVNFSKNKVIFTMSRPCNVAVDINGEMGTRSQSANQGPAQPIVHTLSVHGNPVLENKPQLTDASVLEITAGTKPTAAQLETFRTSTTLRTMYFKPGAHTIGPNFKVYPNKNYYIPGDAIVYGTLNNMDSTSQSDPPANLGSAENMRIFGHGTLSAQGIPHWELQQVELDKVYDGSNLVTVTQADKDSNPTNAKYAEQQRISYRRTAIDLSYCRNTKIQGIVIADPANHAMRLFTQDLHSSQPNDVSWVMACQL